jgi:hypothetical protein
MRGSSPNAPQRAGVARWKAAISVPVRKAVIRPSSSLGDVDGEQRDQGAHARQYTRPPSSPATMRRASSNAPLRTRAEARWKAAMSAPEATPAAANGATWRRTLVVDLPPDAGGHAERWARGDGNAGFPLCRPHRRVVIGERVATRGRSGIECSPWCHQSPKPACLAASDATRDAHARHHTRPPASPVKMRRSSADAPQRTGV